MSSNKKSSTKKSLKLKKGGAFEYAKMFQSSLSPCDKKEMVKNNSQNGGSSSAANNSNNPDTSIRLYDDYSKDWHYPGTPESQIPYAIDSSAGINEYQFGRTTPNNKFIVATGLVKNNVGIEMTGGKKKKKSKRTKSSSIGKVLKKVKSSSKKLVKKVKPVAEKVVKKVKSSSKKLVKKVKSSTTKKSKSKSTKKSKSILNKTKNALKSVGKKVSNLFSKK